MSAIGTRVTSGRRTATCDREKPQALACTVLAGTGIASARLQMQPTPPSKDVIPLPAWRAERRVARRLQPHEVPWIRHVRPASGDTARLVNISSSGLLFETTARLQPGRPGTVVIVDASDRSIEAQGEVVRTELVSVGPHGEPVYQTAMQFHGELDLQWPAASHGSSPAQPLPHFATRIERPLNAEWLTPDGPRPATVTNLTQTGCCVQTDGLGLDQFAQVRVHFAPGRALTLAGTVVAVDDAVGCLVRFENLTARTEGVLRTELLSLASRAPSDLTSVYGLGVVRESETGEAIVVEWQAAGRDGSDPAA